MQAMRCLLYHNDFPYQQNQLAIIASRIKLVMISSLCKVIKIIPRETKF